MRACRRAWLVEEEEEEEKSKLPSYQRQIINFNEVE